MFYRGYEVYEYNNVFPFVTVSGIRDLRPEEIFECGQCFREDRVTFKMDKLFPGHHRAAGDLPELPPEGHPGYITCAFGKCIELFLFRDILYIFNCSFRDFSDVCFDYFDLGRDYSELKKDLVLKDGIMARAVESAPGIRILRQDPFETLISFIVSANNNIPRIKKIIGALCKMAGESADMPECFKEDAEALCLDMSFPTPLALSEKTAEEISFYTHAGYRCDYIHKTSEMYLKNPIDPAKTAKMSYDECFKEISSFCGAGPKVTDCVLLFTGIRYDAFPVDVWVKRVMTDLYDIKEKSIPGIRRFGRDYFGEFAGIAQEYLFSYIRSKYYHSPEGTGI